ncbi:MAG TPA: M56 family metallopeptidase, partial [Gemmataceae bacterium]|nr:M56 family metallopeptidase [Gemmataceae bacterium]
MLRLLFVAAPASPWSVFNLARWLPEAHARQMAPPVILDVADAPPAPNRQGRDSQIQTAIREQGMDVESPQAAEPVADLGELPVSTPSVEASVRGATAEAASSRPRGDRIERLLPAVWLAGCLVFALRLLATAVVLRRRLSACRNVTDAVVLGLLKASSRLIGLKRVPRLLVTPEAVSPCIIGILEPRIVVPESIVTAPSTAPLRRVLAHELAHLVRGDLWTNWLLLAARTVHWFNPAAWWAIRQMQDEREAACDELALAFLGEGDRSAYAGTILDLATNLAPYGVTPGLIGFNSSARRLRARVSRIVDPPALKALRASYALGLLLVIALAGLTDAMPVAAGDQAGTSAEGKAVPTTARPEKGRSETPSARTTLRGRCLDHADRSALRGVRVRLFKVEGRTAPIVEAAKTVTDTEGAFEFANVVTPRPDDEVDRLLYLVFAEADGRPIGYGGTWRMTETNPNYVEIRMLRAETSISGSVVNGRGQVVAGATIMTDYAIDGRPVPGILSATTDAEGKFEIERIPDFRQAFKNSSGPMFTISHPDYPETQLRVADLPAEVTITLPDGCRVTGTVIDATTGKPAAGALVEAERLDEFEKRATSTNAHGRFDIVLTEGRYNFLVKARERVCVALTDQECVAGEPLALPASRLIAGGFISGRVINSVTREPIAVNEQG